MLEKLPPCIQRFQMRLMRFNLHKIFHIPGTEMTTSDPSRRLIEELQSATNFDAFIFAKFAHLLEPGA